jgi:hypothetical protein
MDRPNANLCTLSGKSAHSPNKLEGYSKCARQNTRHVIADEKIVIQVLL